MSMLFISGAEILFVFFIVVLWFGADRIPSIAKGLAKGINQVKQATNDIKSETQNTTDIENPTEKIVDEFKDEIDQVKDVFDEMTDSVKRKFQCFKLKVKPSLIGSNRFLILLSLFNLLLYFFIIFVSLSRSFFRTFPLHKTLSVINKPPDFNFGNTKSKYFI